MYNYDNKAIKYYYILLVSNRLTPLVTKRVHTRLLLKVPKQCTAGGIPKLDVVAEVAPGER